MQPPRVQHRDLDLPEGRVHYVEAGRGEALLLVHGGHGSWTHWIANIEPLAQHRRVIALDLPGFGASFNPQPAFTIAQYAATIGRVLDALSLKRAAIAGFSFGCVVAAVAAGAERSRITHLAMVNSPGIGPASPIAEEIVKTLSSRTVREGLRTGALGSLRQIQLFNHALIDDAIVDLMVANVRQTRFVSRKLSRSLDLGAILAGVKQPLLVLIGREDLHRQHGLADGLRRVPAAAPHAQIHIVECARHWLQFDRAPLFNTLLAEFVA